MSLFSSGLTGKQWLARHHLGEDAAAGPHVDCRRVGLYTQQKGAGRAGK